MLKHPNQPISKRLLNRSALFILLVICGSFSAHLAKAQTAARKNHVSNFTARLVNIEAAANETFRFNTKLYNGTSQAHLYEFKAQLPQGWNGSFKVEGTQVSSFNLDSNKTQDVSIEINASPSVKPGKYEIPVTATATNGSDTIRLNLEAVVRGSYLVELTTPSGRLSDEVTEGSHKEIHLVVKNTGTVTLDNLELSAQAPSKWDATFSPSKIEHLEAGKTQDIVATLNVPNKTIAGDYVTNFSVKNSSATSSASFRITVTTSLLAGWFGMLMILLAIGLVWYLIRKYGRR